MKHLTIKLKTQNSIQLNIFCLYIYWSMLTIGKGFGLTSRDTSYIFLTVGAMPFLLCKILLTQWSGREVIVCAALVVLSGCIYLASGTMTIMLTVLTIIGLKDVCLTQFLKYTGWLKATLFILVFGMAYFGVIDNQMLVQFHDGGTWHRERYGMGMGMPNATHYILFDIFALFVLAYRDRLRWYHFLLFFLVNCCVYSYTDSRTGFLMIVILSFLTIVARYLFVAENVLLQIAVLIYPVLTIFSMMIPWLLMKIPFLSQLGTFSSRFLTAQAIMNTSQITLWGQPGIITDFGIISILYSNGPIALVLFVAGFTWLMYYFKKHRMKEEIIVSICYAGYTVLESYSASILMNMMLLYFSIILFKSCEELLAFQHEES